MGSELINGVKITRLKEIISDKGSVLHFLRNDDPDFTSFGECYISEVYSDAIKGWKIHLEQTQNLIVPVGKVKFVLFDSRNNSESKNLINEIIIDRNDNYLRLTIPPNIYYAFKNLYESNSLIVNCPDIPHDPLESEIIDINSDLIPYEW